MIFNQNPLFLVFYKFFLAIALGALMGLEREKHQKAHHGKDFAGMRTFMLITFLGSLTAYLASFYFDWLLAIIITCFIIVILVGYIMSSLINKQVGMTTELSAIIAFVIGIFTFTTSQEIPILLTIVTTLILSFKSPLHEFAYKLKNKEYLDTIKFVLIAFVILPLLKPIESFGPFNSINLYEIWLMVVFVSSISYIAYILIRLFGSQSGTFLTGILGGMLSSTATVTSLANKSKQYHNTTPLVAAAALACSTMFIRVIIEVSILNIAIIERLAFPMVLLTLAGYIGVSVLWKKSSHDLDTDIEYTSPFMLRPALKFGLFYGFILFLSKGFSLYFGSKGLFIAAVISGLADVDAITIYVARNSALSVNMGVSAIILAAVTNTIVKLFIAKSFGKKEYGNNLIKVLSPAVIIGIILLFIM